MLEKHVTSYDGITLNYAVTEIQPDKPWIALIIPFGMKVSMAKPFFEFFCPQYNVVTWEARSVLEESERLVAENEFAIENHVSDLHIVLESCPAKQFHVVGYCSGAGIALAAANRYPHLIGELILAHGEYTMLEKQGCTTQFAMEIDSLLTLAGRDEEHLGLVFDKIKNDRIDENSNRPQGIDMPFTNKAFLRRHSANYQAYKSVDFAHLAEYTDHQALLMTGELDVQANVLSTETIHALMPNSLLYVDPDADHYGLLRENAKSMVIIWNYLYDQLNKQH